MDSLLLLLLLVYYIYMNYIRYYDGGMHKDFDRYCNKILKVM